MRERPGEGIDRSFGMLGVAKMECDAGWLAFEQQVVGLGKAARGTGRDRQFGRYRRAGDNAVGRAAFEPVRTGHGNFAQIKAGGEVGEPRDTAALFRLPTVEATLAWLGNAR